MPLLLLVFATNWNGSDNSVPENLQLTNLPVLVDQYMEDQDDGAGAIVRYVSKGTNRSKIEKSDKVDVNTSTDVTARLYVDVKCPLCQSFGHHIYNCDRMALWLNLKEGSKSVDDNCVGKFKPTMRMWMPNVKLRNLESSRVLSDNFTSVDNSRKVKHY
jgi:hypothetical protein